MKQQNNQNNWERAIHDGLSVGSRVGTIRLGGLVGALGYRTCPERLGAGGLPRARTHRRGPHPSALLRRVAKVDDRAAMRRLGRGLHGARSLWPSMMSQTDPVTNRVVSFTIGAWEDWNEMIIWM